MLPQLPTLKKPDLGIDSLPQMPRFYPPRLFNDFETDVNNRRKLYLRKLQREYEAKQYTHTPKPNVPNQALIDWQKGRSDYNNTEQMNSFADVIRASIKDVYEKKSPFLLQDFTGQSALHSMELFKQTVVDPITAGNRDALLGNLWTNAMETLDLIDGAFKAYEIERTQSGRQKNEPEAKGFFAKWKQDMVSMARGSHDAGMQGVINWLNNKNYDFESGNFAYDLSREIIQPTMLAGLAKSAVKGVAGKGVKGFATLADPVAKRVIMRNIGGGVDDAIKHALKHRKVSATTKAILSQGAETVFKGDMPRLKFIQQVEHVGDAIDAIDAIPSKIVFNTILAPVKYTFRGVGKGMRAWRNYATSQLGKTVERYVPAEEISVINFVDNAATHYHATYNRMVDIMDDVSTGVPIATVNDYIAQTASQELIHLKELRDSVLLINKFDEIGAMIKTSTNAPYTPQHMSEMVNKVRATASRGQLDKYAHAVTGGRHTYKEYIERLRTLADEAHTTSAPLEELYHTANNMDLLVQSYERFEPINNVVKVINQTLEETTQRIGDDVTALRELLKRKANYTRKTLNRMDEDIQKYYTDKLHLTWERHQDAIIEASKEMKVYNYKDAWQKQYSNYRTLLREHGSLAEALKATPSAKERQRIRQIFEGVERGVLYDPAAKEMLLDVQARKDKVLRRIKSLQDIELNVKYEKYDRLMADKEYFDSIAGKNIFSEELMDIPQHRSVIDGIEASAKQLIDEGINRVLEVREQVVNIPHLRDAMDEIVELMKGYNLDLVYRNGESPFEAFADMTHQIGVIVSDKMRHMETSFDDHIAAMRNVMLPQHMKGVAGDKAIMDVIKDGIGSGAISTIDTVSKVIDDVMTKEIYADLNKVEVSIDYISAADIDGLTGFQNRLRTRYNELLLDIKSLNVFHTDKVRKADIKEVMDNYDILQEFVMMVERHSEEYNKTTHQLTEESVRLSAPMVSPELAESVAEGVLSGEAFKYMDSINNISRIPLPWDGVTKPATVQEAARMLLGYASGMPGKLITVVEQYGDTSMKLDPAIKQVYDLAETIIQSQATIAIEEGAKVYRLSMSNAVQWFMLHDNPDIKPILEMATRKDFTSDVGMQVIDALSRISGGVYEKLEQALAFYDAGQNNIEDIMRVYRAFSGTRDMTDANEIITRIRRLTSLRNDAHIVMETIYGLASMNLLFKDILDNFSDKTLQAKIVDAFQSVYHIDKTASKTFDASASVQREYVKEKIIDQVQNLLQMDGTQHMSLKLDNMQEHLRTLKGDDIDAFRNAYPEGSAHFASADAEAAVLVRKYILEEDAPANVAQIGIDLETNTSNPYIAQINQLGVYDHLSDTRYVIVLTGESASKLDSDLLYKKLYNTETVEEGKHIFDTLHMRGDLDEAKRLLNLGENVQLIKATSTEDMARVAYDLISNQLHRANKTQQFVMHNGLAFDLPVINRMFRTNLKDTHYAIHEYNVYDTLTQLRAKYNIGKLSEIDKLKIGTILDNHVARRSAEPLADIRRGFKRKVRGSDQLIPTMSVNFRIALGNIMKSIDDKSLTHVIKDFAGTDYYSAMQASGGGAFFDHINNAFKGFADVFDTRRKAEDFFNQFAVTVNEIDKMEVMGKFKDAIEKLPEGLRKDANVMDLVYSIADQMGLPEPLITVKTLYNEPKLAQWFNIDRTVEHNTYAMEKIQHVIRNLERTASNIKTTTHIDDFKTMQEARDTLLSLTSEHSYLRLMKPPNNATIAFAQATEIYRNLRRLDIGALRKLNIDARLTQIGLSPEAINMIRTPRSAMRFEIDSAAEVKFHEIGLTKNERVIYDSLSKQATLDLHGLKQLINEEGFTSLVKRMMPTYSKLLDTTHKIKTSVGNTVTDIFNSGQHEVMRTQISKLQRINPRYISDDEVLAAVERTLYAHGRIYLEAVDATTAFHKVESFLKYTPEEMASYLYNYSKGHVYIEASSLLSESYFNIRRNGIAKNDLIKRNLTKLYTEAIAKAEDYGLLVEEIGDFIHIYLDPTKIDEYKKLPNVQLPSAKVVPIKDVFASEHTPYLSYVDSIFSEAVDGTLGTINAINNVAPMSTGSTLEVIGYKAMDNILNETGVVGKGLSIEQISALGMFSSQDFNHTVLGRIDGRRKLLPYSSYNPMKLAHNAARMTHNFNDARHQYFNYLFDEGMTLANLTKEMTDDEVVNYFRGNRDITLAWAKAIKGGDFEVKRFIINNVADVKRAKEMGAVVMDDWIFTKAYQTLNNSKLPTPLKQINKMLVVPWKVGLLAYNAGTVTRNIIDSNLKNYVTANGDPDMIRASIRAMQDLKDYRQAMTEIKKLIPSTGSMEKATDVAFSQGLIKMEREVFNGIVEFKTNTASSGMAAEIMQGFIDKAHEVYKTKGIRSAGIDEQQFRELLSITDAEVDGFLKANVGESASLSYLKSIRAEYRNFKRAAAILDNYRGHVLTPALVVDIINNPKRAELLLARYPDDLTYLKQNIHKQVKIDARRRISNQLANNPVTRNSLTWMGDVEEHARYSLYKYLRDKGASLSEVSFDVKRTHFDYDNKTAKEALAEMLFPFITFKKNSLMYWMDELSSNPRILKHFGNYMTAQADWGAYEPEDFYWQKSVHYALMAGNPIIDRDTGLYAKLQLSLFDVFGFTADPLAYLDEAFLQHLRAGSVDMYERYKNETDEHYNHRVIRKYVGLLPYIGGWASRLMTKGMPEKFRTIFNINDVDDELTLEAQSQYASYMVAAYDRYKLYNNRLNNWEHLTTSQWTALVAMSQSDADKWIASNVKSKGSRQFLKSIRARIRLYMTQNKAHMGYQATLGTLFGQVWTPDQRFDKIEWENFKRTPREFKFKPYYSNYKNRTYTQFKSGYQQRGGYVKNKRLPYLKKSYRKKFNYYDFTNKKQFYKRAYMPYAKFTYRMFKSIHATRRNNNIIVSRMLRTPTSNIWRKLFTRSMKLRGHLEKLPRNRWTYNMHYGLLRYKMKVGFKL